MAAGRCRMHGGASTGPKTATGLEQSRKARWRHGRRSAESRAAARERGEARAVLIALRRLLDGALSAKREANPGEGVGRPRE
jgi:hypothetical protein